jgi:hypothetical protein
MTELLPQELTFFDLLKRLLKRSMVFTNFFSFFTVSLFSILLFTFNFRATV